MLITLSISGNIQQSIKFHRNRSLDRYFLALNSLDFLIEYVCIDNVRVLESISNTHVDSEFQMNCYNMADGATLNIGLNHLTDNEFKTVDAA